MYNKSKKTIGIEEVNLKFIYRCPQCNCKATVMANLIDDELKYHPQCSVCHSKMNYVGYVGVYSEASEASDELFNAHLLL